MLTPSTNQQPRFGEALKRIFNLQGSLPLEVAGFVLPSLDLVPSFYAELSRLRGEQEVSAFNEQTAGVGLQSRIWIVAAAGSLLIIDTLQIGAAVGSQVQVSIQTGTPPAGGSTFLETDFRKAPAQLAVGGSRMPTDTGGPAVAGEFQRWDIPNTQAQNPLIVPVRWVLNGDSGIAISLNLVATNQRLTVNARGRQRPLPTSENF